MINLLIKCLDARGIKYQILTRNKAMSRFKIEKNNISVPGHNGFGRITLIGKDKFLHKTDRQAAQIIGDAVIRASNELLRKENLDFKENGIEVEITFKTYRRICQK